MHAHAHHPQLILLIQLSLPLHFGIIHIDIESKVCRIVHHLVPSLRIRHFRVCNLSLPAIGIVTLRKKGTLRIKRINSGIVFFGNVRLIWDAAC